MSDEQTFAQQVAAKAARKLRAQRAGNQGVWSGLGMVGAIGWSVAVPTILGAMLGRWWDRRHPDGHSWTLMLLVAGINMISALIIIILERVNMIGTLKAMGAENISIRRIFLYVSAFLIGRGLIAGNIFGIGLCLLQNYFHFVHLDQQSYYISYVPVYISAMHILLLNAGSLLVCVAMMILPTLVITHISPLKAIRYS